MEDSEETKLEASPKGQEERERVAKMQTEEAEQTSTKEVSGNEDSAPRQDPVATQQETDSAIVKAQPGDSLQQDTASSSSLPLPLVSEKRLLGYSKDLVSITHIIYTVFVISQCRICAGCLG